MKCERCSKEGAQFVGQMKSWGPDETDADNTAENLPFGCAWLCDECIEQIPMVIEGD